MSEKVSQIIEIEEEIRGVGRAPTIAYFYDLSPNHRYNKYVIKTEADVTVDGVTYQSIHRLYLEEEDPKEYLFAKKYFGSWRVWKRISESPLIKAYIEDMRNELKIRLQSEGVVSLRKKAKEGNIEASKFLANAAWLEKSLGRPAKIEKEKEEINRSRVAATVRNLEKVK